MRPNLQEIADLVTFTEEILIGKLHFLCSVSDEWNIFSMMRNSLNSSFHIYIFNGFSCVLQLETISLT